MTRRRLRFALALPLLLVGIAGIAACASHDETLPNDVTTALAVAFTRGDAEACAALYTDDALIMSGTGQTVEGKQAIQAFFKDQVARDILFETTSAVSLVHGDLAVDQGKYRVRDTHRGLDVEYGQYLNVWRQIDGQWRVFRSMYNVMSAPRSGVSVSTEDDSATNSGSTQH